MPAMLWFRLRIDCRQLDPGVQKDNKKRKKLLNFMFRIAGCFRVFHAHEPPGDFNRVYPREV